MSTESGSYVERDVYPGAILEETSLRVSQELSLDDLIYFLVLKGGAVGIGEEELYSFVVALDQAAVDWDLTKRLHQYFTREMRVYVNEVQEGADDGNDAGLDEFLEKSEALKKATSTVEEPEESGTLVNLDDEATYEAIRIALHAWVGSTTRNHGNGQEYPVDHHALASRVIESLRETVEDVHQPALFDDSELAY